MAVFGLYGAATSKFDISDKLEESGAFVYFWDTFAFVANGIVFFYAGASSVNFVIRSAAPPPLLASTPRQMHACARITEQRSQVRHRGVDAFLAPSPL